MSVVQWLAIGATALLLGGVFIFETRRCCQRYEGINRELASLCCPHCGNRFRAWHGEMSSASYTFIDDAPIPEVIDVTCSACGQHADAFWSPSGELTLDGD